MHSKDADKVANAVDPKSGCSQLIQAAPPEQSDLGLHRLPRPVKTKDHW